LSENTPLLPVQKPGTEDFRPGPLGRKFSNCHFAPQSPKSIHAFRPCPSGGKFFTCLDLKDTFFCIHLAPQNQPSFAFQWENPNNGEKGQLTWT
jgi:hypothetical protein